METYFIHLESDQLVYNGECYTNEDDAINAIVYENRDGVYVVTEFYKATICIRNGVYSLENWQDKAEKIAREANADKQSEESWIDEMRLDYISNQL